MIKSKEEYFEKLRCRWSEAKKVVESGEYDTDYEVATKLGIKMSIVGFVFCKMQMKVQGWEGTPYIDAKTFNGWIKAGFKVRKGEKSKISGITWIEGKKKKDASEDERQDVGFLYPKEYKLFHTSQVEPISHKKNK